MLYKKGERVRHPKLADWGLGEVLADSGNDSVKVFFVGVGEKFLSLKYVQPVHVSSENAHHPVLDNLKVQKCTSKFKYQSLEQSVDCFLTRFPDGFYGELFKKEVGKGKEKAHKQAEELLNEDLLIDCIITGDHQQITENVLAVVHASKLFSSVEKSDLKKALSKADAQKKFSLCLYKLLYCKEKLQGRFVSFSKVLQELNIAKWSIASYFLFIMQPKRYMFIKPNSMQHASELCGFEINFKAQVNWLTYESTLKFSEYLFTELAELKPRDMTDVQLFMCCIAPIQGETKVRHL
ncbi:MAG: DUF3553 domain-containing protein [Psychromonas sp.]|nr:DUF3553 domain-containing protein [Alteromonadales bacterium]MCP5079573.1 DUF3553 domain-containing protein [Psychromonas sp.]